MHEINDLGQNKTSDIVTEKEVEEKKKPEKIDSKIKLPYFMNSHNKNEDKLWNLIKTKNLSLEDTDKSNTNIYSVLANTNANCLPLPSDKIKFPKKNGSYLNIKKLLLKTEDEKHEIDVKLLQFLKTENLLKELQDIYEKNFTEELKEEQDQEIIEEEEDDDNKQDDDQIEEEDDKEKDGENEEETNPLSKSFLNLEKVQNEESVVKNVNQQKVQEIYKKYFQNKKNEEKNISEIDQEAKILNRLRTLKVLSLIYDNHKKKKIQIIDIIKEYKHPLIVNRIRERVVQKIKVLEQVKANLAKNHWKPNMINNFYKILDVRSNGLQQTEKNFITPKYFISSLIETEKEIIKKEQNRQWHKILHQETFMPVITSNNDLMVKCSFKSPTKKESNDQAKAQPITSLRKISTNQKNVKEDESEENQMYDSFVKINSSMGSAHNLISKIEEEELPSKIPQEDIKIEEEEEEHKPIENESFMIKQQETNQTDSYLQRDLVFTNSLMKLLGKSNTFQQSLVYPIERSRFVNPIKMFSMKDMSVIQDSIFFCKVTIPLQ